MLNSRALRLIADDPVYSQSSRGLYWETMAAPRFQGENFLANQAISIIMYDRWQSEIKQ